MNSFEDRFSGRHPLRIGRLTNEVDRTLASDGKIHFINLMLTIKTEATR